MHNHHKIEFADLYGTEEKIITPEIDGIEYTVEYTMYGLGVNDYSIISIEPIPASLAVAQSIHYVVKCEMEDMRNEY